MFSQITYPDATVEFLYQRSAKFMDSSFYGHNIADTIQTTQWNQIYKEMYYAAYDTLTQIHPNIVDSIAASNYGDTINFGIMHWNLYSLKKASLQSGNYFVFDTVNDILYDHTSPISTPYILDSLFMASPLKEKAHFKNVVYRIDPSLIFTDAKTYNTIKSTYILEIDFGDGAGYRTINPTLETFVDIIYPSNGEKIIKTKLTPNTRSGGSYNSTSRIFIQYNETAKVEDYFIRDIPGMNVGVYNACQKGNGNKKIIVVKGIDTYAKIPSKKLSNADYYFKIQQKKIHHLRNYGYDMYMVDWDDSRVDVRLNAYSLLLLIEKLKMEDQAAGNNHEYVIIGISLGGVISKYTINYMESQHYQNDDYEPFFVEANEQEAKDHIWQYPRFMRTHYKYKMWNFYKRKVMKHNTRLLITIDSPHQGANIPLSIQHVLRLGKKLNSVLPIANEDNEAATEAKLEMIDKKATKQLLKYWVKPLTQLATSLTYTPEKSHNTLFNQIKFDNGGDPRFCKVVALSDGAMNGTPQQNIKTNTNRSPGDLLIDMDYDFDIFILGVKLNLVHAYALVNTNPAYSSTPHSIVKVSIGRKKYELELVWFGIRMNHVFNPVFSLSQEAYNVHPYCTAAGGIREDLSGAIKQVGNRLTLKKNIIWKVASSSVNINTDGFHYCFIPIESALDYTGTKLYNNDILNEPIATKMNNTPFDVIAGNVYPRKSVGVYDALMRGETTNLSKSYWLNTEHGWIRNDKDLIYNMTQKPAKDGNKENLDNYAFYTCAINGNFNPLRTFLALEIGDEEMYLENFITDRQTSYRPEYNVKVNVRNPYYWYPNTAISPLKLKGIFSKEKDFNIVSNDYGYPGRATFYYDVSSFLPSASPAPATAGLHIDHISAYSTRYASEDSPFEICCDPSSRAERGSESGLLVKKQQIKDSAALSVYPNPSEENGIVWIKALLPSGESNAVITIYNITGIQMYASTLEKTKGSIKLEKPFNLREINLAKGIYIIKLDTKTNTVSKRLVIQ